MTPSRSGRAAGTGDGEQEARERPPNAQGALTGVGLCLPLAAALVVMLLPERIGDFSAWAGEILGDIFVGWFEHQSQ